MSEVQHPDVQIPSRAVSDKADVRLPVRQLLEDLNLLGSRTDTDKAGKIQAAFEGPPQSVALIEAGATAAAKWWAAGLGASAIAIWSTVVGWWGDQESNIKIAALLGAALVTAAIVISIGHLLASDVRGRAAASVATVEARVRLADEMIRAAVKTYEPSATAAAQLVSLPGGLRVKNQGEPSANEDGWRAIAMERGVDGGLVYIVVKGSSEAKVPADKLEFV